MEEVMREEGWETPPAPKKKRGPRLGKKKKWLVLVLVLAVAAIAAVKLLYTLDSSDAATSQNQAQNSYAQAQRSYEQAVKSKYPTADMSGTVSEVYVRNGDTVSNGTQLCRIVGDNNIYYGFPVFLRKQR